mmetsp:Transcript_14165/g.48830  ORF Transcript_14165/g.48830 Transcript_14165/m.48830 type:complete len:514 (+) Transcript_14165:146-1687(+)
MEIAEVGAAVPAAHKRMSVAFEQASALPKRKRFTTAEPTRTCTSWNTRLIAEQNLGTLPTVKNALRRKGWTKTLNKTEVSKFRSQCVSYGTNITPHAVTRVQPLWPPLRPNGTPRGNVRVDSSQVSKLPQEQDTDKHVMCLMADTGGGHRASAEALKAGFETLYGNSYKVSVIDLWSEHTPWPLSSLPKSYNFMVKHAWLWRLNYNVSNPRLLHGPFLAGMAVICYQKFVAVFEQLRPDLIVSVHPLLQHAPLHALRTRERRYNMRRPPFATVVTDLAACHNTWFHTAVDKCFVPSVELERQAYRMGLKRDQVVLHGLPIRPSFSKALPSQHILRKMLGMHPGLPSALLVGGGEGMGKLEQVAKAMSRLLPSNAQIVIICGRNQKLADRLCAEPWPLKVVVNGFVTNMSEWMSACDCVITKAGPGTIAESLICGKPILLTGAIPCQEEGNIPFVLQHGVGAYSESPSEIASIVANWFGDGKQDFAEMTRRARKLGKPKATWDIVRDLAALIRS